MSLTFVDVQQGLVGLQKAYNNSDKSTEAAELVSQFLVTQSTKKSHSLGTVLLWQFSKVPCGFLV